MIFQEACYARNCVNPVFSAFGLQLNNENSLLPARRGLPYFSALDRPCAASGGRRRRPRSRKVAAPDGTASLRLPGHRSWWNLAGWPRLHACPPGAISPQKQMVRGVERWYVNFDQCIPYFSEAASCGICIAECPWTRPSIRPKLLTTMDRRSGKR
jgi:hypothetical protein